MSFVTLNRFFMKLRALDLVNFRDQMVFRTFFLNACKYWLDFLACKSVTMTYRLSLSFFTLHWFLAKLRALDLVNFHDQTVFRTFFLNACRYWPDFLTCKSVIMTYRLSLSFVTLYQFLAKLRTLDLLNFSDQTVFHTFFLNASRYWAEFWHVSRPS